MWHGFPPEPVLAKAGTGVTAALAFPKHQRGNTIKIAETSVFDYVLPRRGVAQSGSASGLGPEGPEFDLVSPDQPTLTSRATVGRPSLSNDADFSMFSLSGKNALVTGASGGLGKAIAQALYAQGAKVVLSGTKTDALNALKSELGDGAFVAAGNLSDPAVPATLLKEAEAQLGGGVDILVNNAGLTRDGLALRMKDEDWDTVINVNLSAAFRLSVQR